MPNVKRVTMTYDPKEDRLRLSAVDTDGQALGAWLTQRMANALVTSLVECLDDAIEAEPDIIAGAKPASKSMAQLLGQAKADLQKSQADAESRGSVPARLPSPPATSEFVIERVRMRRVNGAYVLDLRWAGGSMSIGGGQTWLRQFLRVIHKNYSKGGWPLNLVWPEWFGENAHRTVLDARQIN